MVNNRGELTDSDVSRGTTSSKAPRRNSPVETIRDILEKIPRMVASGQKTEVSPEVNAQIMLGLRKHRDSLADLRKLDSESGHKYVPCKGYPTEIRQVDFDAIA